MKRTSYYAGGIVDDAPAQNRAEEYDSEAGTFTAWDPDGNVTETRPLTEEEAASLAEAEVAAQATVTQQTIAERILGMLAANDEYLAIENPSDAQVRAQVEQLTRLCNGVIRLSFEQLDTADGT